MFLARRLYRGEQLDKEALQRALRYGVIATLDMIELWAAYGSRSECLAAPAAEVMRVRLALTARRQAEKEAADKMGDNASGGGGTSGGISNYGPQPGMRVAQTRTTSSSNWG